MITSLHDVEHLDTTREILVYQTACVMTVAASIS